MTRRASAGPSPRVGLAVPGAGLGRRMGGSRKALLELAGRPLLMHALEPFLADERVVAVVVALAYDDATDPPPWLAELAPRVRVIAGGSTRTESVRLAIAALPSELDLIAVHDAARPLVTSRVVAECIEVAGGGVGAVAGCPASDTVKRVDAEGRVVETPDRARLWLAHTPQVFPADVARAAYEASGRVGTDDAALVEALGAEVRMVDDGGDNLKVTRPADVALAEAILRGREGPPR